MIKYKVKLKNVLIILFIIQIIVSLCIFIFLNINIDNKYINTSYVFLGYVVFSTANIILIFGLFAELLNILKKLNNNINNINCLDQKLNLNMSNIQEIDIIIDKFNNIFNKLFYNNKKYSLILKDIDNFAVFEYTYNSNKILISEKCLNLLEIDSEFIMSKNKNNFFELQKNDWDTLFERLLDSEYEDLKLLKGAESKYLSIEINYDSNGFFGTILDKTDKIKKLKKKEYRNSHDYLTGLYNVSYFKIKAQKILEENKNKVNAIIFSDLDNLKYINDTYGHAFGDIYIKNMSEILKSVQNNFQSISCRISGDEFITLVYGYQNKEDINDIVSLMFNTNSLDLSLPNGDKYKIKCSAGISWAPEDSSNIEELIKFSNFSMYMMKKNSKGIIGEFNKLLYNKKSFLLENQEEFNTFIQMNQVRYVYQPIVDIVDKKIFAYEALMRPINKIFANPEKLIEMAQSQSQLHLVEKMTFLNILKIYDENQKLLEDKLLFINSIPNQFLDKESLNIINDKYKRHFKKIVVEITENEKIEDNVYKTKYDFIKELGGNIAIDDYGSGYNNEMVVINTNPEFVKIDMLIVRDINKNIDKQQLVKNIVNLCKSKKISIIAEGVETKEELDVIKSFGIRYVQGYYFSKPNDTFKELDDGIFQTI